MPLTEEQLTQFQNLYQKHFGTTISREQAYEEGMKLVRLMQLISNPMTKKDDERLQERRSQDQHNR